MAKKIIVKLWKDGVGRSLVATSQVITLDGLGSGPVVASDFADNTLQGTVNTSAQRGGFYKELKSPAWNLTPLKTQVTAGNNIVLNWSTRPADTTPTINWYAVNTGQQIIYTGAGLVSNKSSTPLVISGEGGTFNVATAPVDVNREVEITIWNGEFGISNLLARSGPIRIIAKELQVSLPQFVAFRTPIPLNISGYPGEFVTFEGASTGYAKGIKGNVTLDSAGRFYLGDIRGGIEAPPGPYSYKFDGNITASPKEATVVITTEGFYALQFTTTPPSIITIGDSLIIGISGAPHELVTYNGASIGTFNLNSSGTASTPNLTNGVTLLANKQYTWRFNGNISINSLAATVNTVAGKELNATGPSPIPQATAWSVTVTGKANDTITYTDVKQNIPILYFDYYPEAESAFINAGVQDPTTFISTYHSTIGSGLGFLSPGTLTTEYNKNYTGNFVLTDIGGDNGSLTYQVINSLGLVGRKTPYRFRFYSQTLNQTKEVNVTVNRIFTLKVTGPASVETGSPIPITVYSAAGDNTVKVTGPNLPVGGYTLNMFDGTGQFTFSLQSPSNLTSPLPSGSYTFNFDSARSDVINAGGAAFTPYEVRVTQKQDLTPIHVPLEGYGQDEIPPNTIYQLQLRSAVGDIIEIEKNLPATWQATNAYFDLYPDVAGLFEKQQVFNDRANYAKAHFETIGQSEGRVSPTAAVEYRNNLEPTEKLTFGPLVKPNSSVEYGQVLANIGSYRYPLSSPITLRIKGKGQELSKSFRVKLLSDLTVNLPSIAAVDDVVVSIRGVSRDEITCVKIESNSPDNLPRPIVPRQERVFILGDDGIFVGDFLAGTQNANGTLDDLTPNAPNVYYFYSKKTGATTQAAVRGGSLVVITGSGMLYPLQSGSKGTYSSPELIAELPTQAVWVMWAAVSGGGGGGGDDSKFEEGSFYVGGSGTYGISGRGVIRLPAGAGKKIYGVAGAGGRSGYWGSGAAGGLGGDGATINPDGRLVSGKGGDGGSSGTAGYSGSAGGGGGSTVLAVSGVSGITGTMGIVALGGGGGGGGASWRTYGNPGRALPGTTTFTDISNNTAFANRVLDGAQGSGKGGGDGGGGGGGGGGAGIGGGAGQDQNSGGGGGTTGYAFYRSATSAIQYEASEYSILADYATNKIGNRNYFGVGGPQKGTGGPGAIKIYWTTATEKPTDYGLLPEFPVPGKDGFAELRWTVPSISFPKTENTESFFIINNGGRWDARMEFNDGPVYQVIPGSGSVMAKYTDGQEAPASAFADYFVRITVVSNNGIQLYGAHGGLAVGQNRQWRFKDFTYLNNEAEGCCAQTKIEIIKPDGTTIVGTGFISWR